MKIVLYFTGVALLATVGAHQKDSKYDSKFKYESKPSKYEVSSNFNDVYDYDYDNGNDHDYRDDHDYDHRQAGHQCRPPPPPPPSPQRSYQHSGGCSSSCQHQGQSHSVSCRGSYSGSYKGHGGGGSKCGGSCRRKREVEDPRTENPGKTSSAFSNSNFLLLGALQKSVGSQTGENDNVKMT